MGRKKLEIKRMNTTVTIREDLKNNAKKRNLNLSKLLEEAIIKELERSKNE